MQKTKKTETSTRTKCIFSVIVPLLLLLLVPGCSKYQYVRISSNLEKNEYDEFIFENDTAFLQYSFKGRDFPLSVNVYNKLATPLYFNVSKSPVFVNDYLVDMPFDVESQVWYIAPLSMATITSYPISDKFIDMTRQDTFMVKTYETYPYSKYSYTEQTSPVYMRCLMTFSGDENSSDNIVYDNAFWISDLVQSINGPKSSTTRSDYHFYLKKTSGFGKTLGWAGIISLLILRFALDDSIAE